MGLDGGQPLRLEQQIIEIAVSTASSKPGFDVSIHRLDHADLQITHLPNFLKPTDTVDKIDFKKMTEIARLVFETGWRIANLDHRLSKTQ